MRKTKKNQDQNESPGWKSLHFKNNVYGVRKKGIFCQSLVNRSGKLLQTGNQKKYTREQINKDRAKLPPLLYCEIQICRIVKEKKKNNSWT